MRIAHSWRTRFWKLTAAGLLAGTALAGVALAPPAATADVSNSEWKELNGAFKRSFIPLKPSLKRCFANSKQERKACRKTPKATGAIESREAERTKKADFREELKGVREGRSDVVAKLLKADDSRALEALAKGLRSVNDDLKALIKVVDEYTQAVAAYKPDAGNTVHYTIPGDQEWHTWAKAELGAVQEFVTIEQKLKRQILDGLTQVGGGSAMDWLKDALLKNKSAEVRAGAAQAIGAKNATGNISALCEAYPKEKDGLVRVAIIDGLLSLRATDAKDTFLAALKDEKWEVRAAAVDAIDSLNYKDAGTIEALIETIANEDGRLRGDIEEVLHRLTGMRFAADGLLWRKWWADNKEKFAKGEIGGAKAGGKGLSDDGGGFNAPAPASGGGGGHSKVEFYGIKTYSNRIVFVLDRSGSMKEKAGGQHAKKGGPVLSGHGNGGGDSKGGPEGDTKIDVAKWELKKAVMGLSTDVMFTIIFYNENFEIWREDLQKATRANKKEAIKYIMDLPAAGATNIFDSLEKAFGIGMPGPGQVQDKRYAKKNASADTIFLLSDGSPNKGRITEPNAILEEIRKMNKLRRITIHTIGIGKGDNRPFMSALAKQNRGTYVHRD